MSSYRYCHCGKVVVAYVLSTEAVAKIPSTWNLCKDHFRESLGMPPAKPREPAAHPAYKGKRPPTCYGDGGRCPNEGKLTAQGQWCGENGHTPKPGLTGWSKQISQENYERAREGSLGGGAYREDHSLEAVDSGA